MSGGGIAGILMIFLLVIVLFIAASCVKIVPQASAYVVESLGKYDRINLHRNVIFCNDRLRREIHHLLF